VLKDYGFKPSADGKWLNQGKCPACGKRELFTSAENPWVLRCGRANKCGQEFSVRDLYPEEFRDFTKRFEATPQNPTATADAYMREARGLNTMLMKGYYTQEKWWSNQANGGTATVGLRVYQDEVDDEFIFKVKMLRAESGLWQTTEITNFREFIALVMKARQDQLKDYLTAADAVIDRHEAVIRAADRKLVETLQQGNLGDTVTRQAMKKIMEEEVLPDWHQREAELQTLSVPVQAQSLQRLRLRICAAQIQYAEAYAEWLDTKSAATVRKANELLKEAKTLEHEAKVLHQMQTKNK